MNPKAPEIRRRYDRLREAMVTGNVDAVLVCGNQYAGFEGAVRYISGFEIVHRYAYVLVPLEGEPTLVFPREARWIGDKKKTWIANQVWPDVPGKWLCQHFQKSGVKRVGVVGLDFVMPVRDYRELQGRAELLPFDFQFDMMRAIKSDAEFSEIRDSMSIILDGFWRLVEGFSPGRTEAEIMAPATQRFVARGAGSRMMNMVLSGSNGSAEPFFKLPAHRTVETDDLVLCSLEITGSEGYWVEFSRPLIRGKLSPTSERMKEIYPEAMAAGKRLLREGELASNVHRAVTEKLARYKFSLGHLSGHSIGQTMIEHPAIGANTDVVLRENMVFSLHPQVVDEKGRICLYTQDTYRVGKTEGENLCNVPWKFFHGGEVEPSGSGKSATERKPSLD